MNANYGILQPMPVRIRDKKERYRALSLRAIEAVKAERAKEGKGTIEENEDGI
jgi:folate-dependent tRNA-U54 methylase TrmFO/GidA